MPRSIVVFAEGEQHGKSVLATGLAQRLENAGREPLLVRVGDPADPRAVADAEFFGRLSFGVGESPLGLTQAASMLGDLDNAVLVAEVSGVDPAEASSRLDAAAISAGPPSDATRSALGTRFKGWVAFGLSDADSLAVIPRDPVLLAPTVREALSALPPTSTVRFLDNGDSEICEFVAIAPISHDTGRTYFNLPGKAVTVCRDDKPELALAAIAGDTALLVVTGGDEPLGYVAERAAAARIPLVITPESTVPTVQRLESVFAPRPIRHPRQVKRAAELLSEIDLEALLRSA